MPLGNWYFGSNGFKWRFILFLTHRGEENSMSAFDKLYSGFFNFICNLLGNDFSISSFLFVKSIFWWKAPNLRGLEPSISKLYKFMDQFRFVWSCLNFYSSQMHAVHSFSRYSIFHALVTHFRSSSYILTVSK